MTLEVEVQIDHFIPKGSNLELQIPKSHANLKAFYAPGSEAHSHTFTNFKQAAGAPDALTLDSATLDGNAITMGAMTVAASDDWNPDVVTIPLPASDEIDPYSPVAGSKELRILKLVISNYIPPIST